VTDGVLSGHAIREAVERGDIVIDPYDTKQINPASYDVRLGTGVAVYDDWVYPVREEMRPREDRDGSLLAPYTGSGSRVPILDTKREPQVTRFAIGCEGWVLLPGIGYLMHTAERITTKRYQPVIDGKSSIGRLFINVHATAGYGEAGFDGQYTLEVTVKHPVRVYAGMRFAQMRFHTIHGEVQLYDGNYKGETSRGAVASRAYKQFDQ
jgi:dCTP deaminase